MEKILFFMNFLKNNIVLPRNATKATKATVEVMLPESPRRAISSCDTFIGCQGVVGGTMRPKTCRFTNFLQIVVTRFFIYAFKLNLKKVILGVFLHFLPCKIAEFLVKITKNQEK